MCDVKVIKKKAKIRSLQKLPDIQYLKIYFLSIKVYSITGTSKCTNVDKPGKVKYDFYHILVRHPREPNVIWFYYHQYLWARDNLSVHWHSIYAWMRNLRWLYTCTCTHDEIQSFSRTPWTISWISGKSWSNPLFWL